MVNSPAQIKTFAGFSVLVLILSIFVLSYSLREPAEEVTKPSFASIIKDELADEELANQIREEYNEFPIYYGEGLISRNFLHTTDGFVMEITAKEDLNSIVYWHYEEFEEEGYLITDEPDIYNESYQRFSAVKENIHVVFVAEKSNDNELFIKIIVNK